LIDDVTLARAIHVIAVVFWIGGVAMVTTVLLPAVRRFKSSDERVVFFESVEKRFAAQSRVSTLAAGSSGFYMIYRLDLWSQFASVAFWWMHAMTALWRIFTLMLFVLEPLFLHRWFRPGSNGAGCDLPADPRAALVFVEFEHHHDLRRHHRQPRLAAIRMIR
jgi:hypothetical protein